MSGELQGLLILHDIAARDKCGLIPELEALLRARADAIAAGAIPLPVRMHSSGPTHQTASNAQQPAVEPLQALREISR